MARRSSKTLWITTGVFSFLGILAGRAFVMSGCRLANTIAPTSNPRQPFRRW